MRYQYLLIVSYAACYSQFPLACQKGAFAARFDCRYFSLVILFTEFVYSHRLLSSTNYRVLSNRLPVRIDLLNS